MKNDFSYKQALFNYLSKYLTSNKLQKFREIIRHRTKHVTIALENIYQSHNASAVLRTCDCFGILDVHIIENDYSFQVSKDIALGSNKWLNLYHYRNYKNNTLTCIEKLKKDGYRIIATTPHTNDCLIHELPIENKMAFFFGTELEGLSEEVMANSDEYVRIPMYGFTESYNISVSAAILLYDVITRLHASETNWQISHEEETDTLLSWAKNVIKKPELLEQKFRDNWK